MNARMLLRLEKGCRETSNWRWSKETCTNLRRKQHEPTNHRTEGALTASSGTMPTNSSNSNKLQGPVLPMTSQPGLTLSTFPVQRRSLESTVDGLSV